MKKTVTSLILFSIYLTAGAANVATNSFVIDAVRISDHTGNAYIDPVGNPQIINSSCPETALYAFHKDDELFNQLYSTALAAGAAGKSVRVWVSDAVNDCLSGFQRIRVIDVDF